MNRIKGLPLGLGVAVLMAVVAACENGAEPTSLSDEVPTLAPPTVGGTTPPESDPPTTSIGQALEAAEGSEVTVSGYLIADWDGNTRLCSGLLESGPPQCGDDRIDLLGFDASSVPNSETPQRPSEIRTSRWTNSQITVTGIKGIGGLANVRLSTEAPSPIVSHGGPVDDYVSLVDNLRAAGAAIEPAGSVSQPFFAPQGQVLTVTGEDVQAFEFASAEEADTVAETVSADGSSIGTSMVRWVAPPHFYKAGKLIVIYVGGDSDVINALQKAMGPQFAGGEYLPPAPGAQPVPPVSSTMLVPRPESIEVLVRMSHIIVLGTVSAVLDEKLIGAYGEDGNPYIPVEESGSPYTDYEVRVESVLKNDDDVEDGGTLVLRMFGHLSQQSAAVTLAAVQLPQPGSHYLLALGRNPDDTYGSGSEVLIYVDGETVAYADGVAFSTELAGEEFVEAVRQEIGGKSLSATSINIAPTTSGVVLTEDRFRDLITIEDVETRLSVKVSLKVELRDFKEMAGRADPSQVEKMDSWYGMTIEAADGGPGMTALRSTRT